MTLYRWLLQLWRIVPLPASLRAHILWIRNTHYLIAVTGLVWDDAGRLLLARHTYLPHPGWDLPGGNLQGLESLEAGLARELEEELGFAVELGPLVCTLVAPSPRRAVFGFNCRAREGSFRPNAEIAEIAYFSLQDALRLLRPESQAMVMRAARRREVQPSDEPGGG